MDSLVRASGQLHIEFLDQSGNLIDELWVKNIVVALGLTWMAQRLANTSNDTIAMMAIGDGSIPTAPGDYALTHETKRLATTVTPAVSPPSFVAVTTFNAGDGTGVVSELGLFLLSGTLLAHAVIPAQPKSSTTSMRISWTISLTS